MSLTLSQRYINQVLRLTNLDEASPIGEVIASKDNPYLPMKGAVGNRRGRMKVILGDTKGGWVDGHVPYGGKKSIREWLEAKLKKYDPETSADFRIGFGCHEIAKRAFLEKTPTCLTTNQSVLNPTFLIDRNIGVGAVTFWSFEVDNPDWAGKQSLDIIKSIQHVFPHFDAFFGQYDISWKIMFTGGRGFHLQCFFSPEARIGIPHIKILKEGVESVWREHSFSYALFDKDNVIDKQACRFAGSIHGKTGNRAFFMNEGSDFESVVESLEKIVPSIPNSKFYKKVRQEEIDSFRCRQKNSESLYNWLLNNAKLDDPMTRGIVLQLQDWILNYGHYDPFNPEHEPFLKAVAVAMIHRNKALDSIPSNEKRFKKWNVFKRHNEYASFIFDQFQTAFPPEEIAEAQENKPVSSSVDPTSTWLDFTDYQDTVGFGYKSVYPSSSSSSLLFRKVESEREKNSGNSSIRYWKASPPQRRKPTRKEIIEEKKRKLAADKERAEKLKEKAFNPILTAKELDFGDNFTKKIKVIKLINNQSKEESKTWKKADKGGGALQRIGSLKRIAANGIPEGTFTSAIHNGTISALLKRYGYDKTVEIATFRVSQDRALDRTKRLAHLSRTFDENLAPSAFACFPQDFDFKNPETLPQRLKDVYAYFLNESNHPHAKNGKRGQTFRNILVCVLHMIGKYGQNEGGGGIIYLSQNWIAEKVGTHVSTVNRALKHLFDKNAKDLRFLSSPLNGLCRIKSNKASFPLGRIATLGKKNETSAGYVAYETFPNEKIRLSLDRTTKDMISSSVDDNKDEEVMRKDTANKNKASKSSVVTNNEVAVLSNKNENEKKKTPNEYICLVGNGP